MAETVEDKRQIGLTLAGSEALGKLMEEGLFDSESDAYKLAIAYALAKGVHPDAAPSGGYQTKFNAAGGIDIDGQVRDLISVLLPDCSERPYAAAEGEFGRPTRGGTLRLACSRIVDADLRVCRARQGSSMSGAVGAGPSDVLA